MPLLFIFPVQKRARMVSDIDDGISPSHTPSTPRPQTPNSDNELNVEEEEDQNSDQSSIGAPENLSLKETRSTQYDDILVPIKHEHVHDKWPGMDDPQYMANQSPPSKYSHQIQNLSTIRDDRDTVPRKLARGLSSSSDTPDLPQQSTVVDSDNSSPNRSDTINETQLDNSFESDKISPQYGSPGNRSPVDVLLRVFPGRRRSEIEHLLSKCKGDVVLAMEAMLSGGASTLLAGNLGSYGLTQDSPPYSLPGYQGKSAFSPLGGQNMKFSPSRRFLTPPYSGTGYLSTVIRPPAEYLAGFLPPTPDMLSRRARASPPSPRSDHANNDGFSD